jgi:two-component system, NtrC family, sensor histidine kinase HydH
VVQEKKTSTGRRARWGLLVSALILGVMLVVIATLGYNSARQVAVTAAEGQAELLLRQLRLEGNAADISSEELERFVSNYSSLGLRYLALMDKNGEILAEAGQQAVGSKVEAGDLHGKRRLEKIGDRIQMISLTPPPQHLPLHERRPRRAENFNGRPPPPRPGDFNNGFQPRDGEPPGRFPPQPPPKLSTGEDRPIQSPWLILEFEPTLLRNLEGRAMATLILSLVVSALLTGAAVVFWRLTLRADAAAARSEQQRRLAVLGEMSAVMAHEIRNPLGSLKGHAQLLAERFASGTPERKKSEQVVQEAFRLEWLTNDLLDFARPLEVRLQDANPAELLREAAGSLSEARFDLKVDDAPRTWSLDPVRIRQLLLNLLRNALQASPDSMQVSARVFLEKRQLCFVIRDHGQGIVPGDEEKIFEPFQTKSVRGVGLGLAVARRIVELHGGFIRAENHRQGGAEITVIIPAKG